MNKITDIKNYEYLIESLKEEMQIGFKEDKESGNLKEIELPEIVKNNIINNNIKCYNSNALIYFVNNNDVLFVTDQSFFDMGILLSKLNDNRMLEKGIELVNAFFRIFTNDFFMYDEEVSDETHDVVLGILNEVV